MYKQEEYSFTLNEFNIDDINITPLTGDMHGDFLVLSPGAVDETMDVAAKFEHHHEFIPTSPRGPPERTVFAGELDFQVEISSQDTSRKKYLYSSRLNRIYVDMRKDFPVSFRWTQLAPAYVRACVVFSDEAQAEKRVERCTQHTHDASNADISLEIVKNVLHSSREKGTHGVHYCGRPELPDSWYSVLVELGPTGGSHAYQFVCKNSCSSGINRRAIDVIFTLEDSNGRVYGRQTVGARACSCPRRDILRDEEEAAGARGKRRAQPAPAPPAPAPPVGKKVKLEAVEVDDSIGSIVTLPPIQIAGVRTAVTGLQMMLSMMEQAAELRAADAAAAGKYARLIAALRDKIDEMKRPQ